MPHNPAYNKGVATPGLPLDLGFEFILQTRKA